MSDPPAIDHGHANLRPTRSLPTPIIIGLATVLALIAIVVIRDGMKLVRVHDTCRDRLGMIGQVIWLYAGDHQTSFPPDLQTLARYGESIDVDRLLRNAMVCPVSSDNKPENAASIANPSRCSYIYIGADLTTRSNPKCVVAVEDPANHWPKGANVLFADGHAEFLDLPTIQLILNNLTTGHNPPATLTPTLSQAAAEQDYQTNWKPRMPQLKTGVWRIPTTQPAAGPK